MDARHKSYSRLLPDSRTAILFVHGICGSPAFFEDFYTRVPEHWSIRSLLLAGHGGSTRDFARTSMDTWKDQVRKETEALAKTHETVILAGHSMGSLLSIGQSFETENIKGLFLMAVPLKLHPRPISVLHSTMTALGLNRGAKPELKAARRLYGIEPDIRIWRYLGFIPRYHELLLEMKEIRERVPEIATPCRAIFSRQDEIVSPSSADYLAGNPWIQIGWLEESDHKYQPPEDKALLLSEFESFCRAWA